MKKTVKQFLTLKHYKEPLLKVPRGEGYGFFGAIQITVDGSKMQCHVCGRLFEEVASHARQAHKITLKEYRLKYRLNSTTSLISEKTREERKQRTLKWLASLSPVEREEMRKKARAKFKEYLKRRGERVQPKESLENKNIKGTCPDQLLAKIIEVSKKLDKTPTLAEFIDSTGGQRYKHLIFKVFGSWSEAVKRAKLDPHERNLEYSKKRYSNDELLDYLSLYFHENNRVPTATDSKRGLIPDYAIYQRRFGSMAVAREMAGIPKWAPTKWEQK